MSDHDEAGRQHARDLQSLMFEPYREMLRHFNEVEGLLRRERELHGDSRPEVLDALEHLKGLEPSEESPSAEPRSRGGEHT